MALELNDYIEITVWSTLFEQRIISTFPYVVTSPSTGANDLTVCQNIADYWQAGTVSPFLSFVACCPQNMNIDFVQVQKVHPTRFRAMRSIFNQPGTDAADATSANTAASIERSCEQAGRAFVGRLSIPGLAPANQDDGKVGAAMLAKMSTLGSKMLNEYFNNAQVDPTLILTPCLYHRQKDPVTEKWEYVGFSVLYATFPQDTVRTMRSRTLRKGI